MTRIGKQVLARGVGSSGRLGLVAAFLAVGVGCNSAPKTQPRILRYTSPVGAPAAPPLNNARAPIAVPSAPLGRAVIPAPTAVVAAPAPCSTCPNTPETRRVPPTPAGYPSSNPYDPAVAPAGHTQPLAPPSTSELP